MLSRPGLRCRSFDSLFTCAGHFQCNEVGDTLDITGYVFSLAADQDLIGWLPDVLEFGANKPN